jgi:hypothetical protein
LQVPVAKVMKHSSKNCGKRDDDQSDNAQAESDKEKN